MFESIDIKFKFILNKNCSFSLLIKYNLIFKNILN